MLDWWNALSPVLHVLYCIAAPATIILVLQTILMLVSGFDSGAGVNFSDTSGLDLDASNLDTGGFEIDVDVPDGTYTDGSSPGDFSALRVFTLQTVVAFLTVFSWSSIAAISAGSNPKTSMLVGFALGVVGMVAVAKLVQVSTRLAENGTLNLQNAIGETGKVYLPIPSEGAGTGKVMLCVQGSMIECEAVTQGGPLRTGQSVRVVDVHGGALVVEAED